MKKLNVTLAILVAAVTALSANAATITINPGAASNAAWNTAIWGTTPAVPTSGNDYIHNINGRNIRGGGTHGEFSGDKFIARNGAQLGLSGNVTNLNLVLDGGRMDTRNTGISTVNGTLVVASNSSIVVRNGNLVMNATLSGSSQLTLLNEAVNSIGNAMTISGTDGGFSGTFRAIESVNAGANRPLLLTFGTSYEGATLQIDQANTIANAAVYQLTGAISFKNVLMPDGSGGLVDLLPGTYNATALGAAGVSSTYYNNLGGSIVVIPEPSSAALVAGALGALVLLRRRRRKS